jgi:hypothetical protein
VFSFLLRSLPFVGVLGSGEVAYISGFWNVGMGGVECSVGRNVVLPVGVALSKAEDLAVMLPWSVVIGVEGVGGDSRPLPPPHRRILLDVSRSMIEGVTRERLLMRESRNGKPELFSRRVF